MSQRNAGCFVLLVALLSPRIVSSQGTTLSQDAVWTRIDSKGIRIQGFEPWPNTSGLYSAFILNQEKVESILKTAPREFTEDAKQKTIVVTIPFPDGRFERFRIEESPVISKPLESAGFETHTYKGIGIDDPTATIRFESAYDGFHAMIRSSTGVFYIDPAPKDSFEKGKGPYLSYFSSARPTPPRKLHCEVSGERAEQDRKRNSASRRPTVRPLKPQAFVPQLGNLRIYRFALAVNSYYVDAVYDKSRSASRFDQTAAAITRTLNRINEIYEAEHGIHFKFVDDEAKVIYIDPKTDPYRNVNSDANAALTVNQQNLNAVIGNSNYDIGHLFTTDTSGLASVASVCRTAYKAQGVTGIGTPSGDPFDVDYVAHEIGHQFGANHTFNAISGYCKGNRFASTAYEPGSGSTIMGYAGNGICDPASIQDHSDPYFHVASLIEIQDYVSDSSPESGGSCATLQPLPFDPPSFSVSGVYTIPKGTPFVLSAATANSQSSKYKFTWEEFDLGDPAPPDDENGPNATPRPLFRSRPARSSAVRFFPDFTILVQTPGKQVLGEALPMLDRTMKFRLTTRNNHGSFVYSEVAVTIDSKSGPFRILQTNEGKTWQQGSLHKLRWEVARTNRPPVNCLRLLIQLAVDEDPSKILTLAQGIPNSGSYELTIPEATPLTGRARLILKSEDNIFLAVSPFVIQISPKQ